MALFSGLSGPMLNAALAMPTGIAGGAPAKQMGGGRGLFAGLRRGIGGLDPSRLAMSQALLNGDYGAAAQIVGAQRRQQAEQAEAEAEAQALAQMREQAMATGISKNQAFALSPQDLSQLVYQRSIPRQFGPEGGTVTNPDGTTYRAPSRNQVGRSIIDFGANSNTPNTLYEGVEPVSVQPGGAVYGMTGTGRIVDGGGAGAAADIPAPPGGGPTPGTVVNGFRFRGGNPNDRNSWEPVGGAGGGAQRPFDATQIPANFTSGRRTPEGNRLVGGVTNSAHLRGDAADFTPRSGQSMAGLAAELRRRFPGARIINEGDHVHVQQAGLNVPYHGRVGTTGLRRN